MSQKVATARKSENDARSQAMRATSTSTGQSKLRDADRHANTAASAEKARADLEQKAASKEKQLYEARARADKERLQAQERSDRDRDRAQQQTVQRLEARLRAEQFDRTRLSSSWSPPPSASSALIAAPTKRFDLFISHASEDKDSIARPLFEALTALGLMVWFDEATLSVGDSLRQKIEEGLANSTFGVVILSQSFFQKQWPQSELNGLHARQMSNGKKVILPIWHNISKDEIVAVAPMLADILGLPTSLMTAEEIASELFKVVRTEQ